MEEATRLRGVRELAVLDTPPEPVFDSLTRLAAQLCNAPTALLALVDETRIWFKAQVGLPGAGELPRGLGFCTREIEGDGLFEVSDASLDPRFAGHPWVIGGPQIRFYAGASLVLSCGARVGTLCVLDRVPRRLDADQAAALRQVAHAATQALEMRRDLIRQSSAARSDYELVLAEREARYKAIVETQAELVSLADADGLMSYVNPSFARHYGRPREWFVGRSLYELVDPADQELVRNHLSRVMADGISRNESNRLITPDGRERWVAWTNSVQYEGGRRMLHSVGRDITDQRRAELALRASESLLRRIGRVAGVGGWEYDLASQRLTWSDGMRTLHEVPEGFEPDAESGFRFYPPEARPVLEAAIQAAMEHGSDWDLEVPFVTASGRRLWTRSVGEAEQEDGRTVRLVGALQDVSERKQLEEQVARQTETLRLVTEAIPAIVAVIGADGRFRFVNNAFEHWIGRPRRQIVGRQLSEVLGDDGPDQGRERLAQVLAGQAVHFERSFPDRRDFAHLAISYIPLYLEDEDGGHVDGFISVAQDITTLKLEAARLARLAHRDALTGLLNRAGFEHFLEERVGRAERLAVLWIDLDHFKPVNDRHGHAAGDKLLQMFAQRLNHLVRPADAVARIGGDEFALVLEGVREPAIAAQVAEKVVDAARAPFVTADGLELQIGASVGIAIADAHTRDWETLVAEADAMLYQAKRAGRGRHAFSLTSF